MVQTDEEIREKSSGTTVADASGNGGKYTREIRLTIIATVLLAICGTSLWVATGLAVERGKAQTEALFQEAMKRAPSGSIPAWCIAGKTYVRGNDGGTIALEANGKPLECAANASGNLVSIGGVQR